jgi:hypothetical protein
VAGPASALAGNTGGASAVNAEQALETEGTPPEQTPETDAKRAELLERDLEALRQHAGNYAKARTVSLLWIGKAAAKYLGHRLRGETDAKIRRESRAAGVNRLQRELDDVCGQSDTPQVEDCLRLHGVAEVYGREGCKALGIGQIRPFETTLKRQSGKDAKPEHWEFKPDLTAEQVGELQAMFAALVDGTQVMTAAETSIAVRRVTGKLTAEQGADKEKAKEERASKPKGEKDEGQKPQAEPESPREAAERIKALLSGPTHCAVLVQLGTILRWTQEMGDSLAQGLVNANDRNSLAYLSKAMIDGSKKAAKAVVGEKAKVA